MIQYVIFVCVSMVLSVVSNPLPQVIPSQNLPINQQNLYANPNTAPTCQQSANQNSPYSQTDTAQHQTQNRAGNLNQLLISKIFENPCVQKILDPNTKLYNQRGHEIQRQPNGGSAPNVINNYFIVPPEFFSLNYNKTGSETQTGARRRKGNNRRKTNRNKITAKKNFAINDNDSIIGTDKLPNQQTNLKRNKNGQKKQKMNQTSAKIIELDSPCFTDEGNNTIPIIKKGKRKRKGGSSNLTKAAETVTSKEKLHGQEIENIYDKNQNQTKKRSKSLKTKTKPQGTPSDARDIDHSAVDSTKNKNKKVIENSTKPRLEIGNKNTNDKIETINSSNETQLKNIELPVDNRETSKDHTENRKTRNSKNNRSKKEELSTPRFSPILDDFYKNLFPYMYLGNHFYPNGNYPFNLDQLYQPNYASNNVKKKNRKNRTKQNGKNNQDSITNVVEVPITLKPKIEEVTTTPAPTIAESTEETQTQSDYSNSKYTTSTISPTTVISVESYDEETFAQSSEEEYDPVITKNESVVTKANLEMPPTVIEDLHNFMTPDLGIEEIVPTIQTNSIINDYYPIFNDDSYYNKDESYYLADLEDDRHFYTTGQSHEEQLNRDRRKYEKYEDHRAPNLDIKDQINFRRGNKLNEPDKKYIIRDDIDNFLSSPYSHAKLTKLEDVPSTKEDEIQFHTPPLLENPDFRTKKVELGSSISSVKSDGVHEPVYTGFASENIPDKNEPPVSELARIVDSDKDIRKERVPSKHVRPKNDHIETVFAKTRVVKYGIARDDLEENTSISMPTYEDENESKYFSDGHTTFVMAKSLGHVDDYYW